MNLVPLAGLLIGVCIRQQRRLVESLTYHLQPYRHIVGSEAAWHRNSGKPGEIYVDCANIAQIHRERIGRFLAEFKGLRRRSRSHNDINGFKCLLEISAYERADFLGAQIIGVVVSGTQNVASLNNSALDFLSEALGAAFDINIDNIFCIRASVGIPDAVVAGEI